MCEIAASVDAAQAVGYLETALGYAPQHERAVSTLEALLEGGHDAQRLAACWVAYLAAAPSGQAAHRRRVKLARAYVAQGQLEDAIFCLEPAAQGGFSGATELLDELRPRARGSAGPAAPASPPGNRARSTKPPPRPASRPASRPVAASAARSTPEPPPAAEASSRDITDLDDVQTVVGEPELIDSLREAAAEDERRARAVALERASEPGGAAPPVPAEAAPALEELESLDEADAIEQPEEQPEEPPPPRLSELPERRRQAAALAREHRQDEAAAAYEEILRADPLDREAFAFLDGFYRRKQQHSRRALLLERSAAAEGLPSRVRITRLREAAGTYEARLKDYDAAIRTLHLLSQIDPEADDAQRALKRLLERAERWDELAVVLESELARAKDAEPKLPLLRRLASLHRERREDLGAAADALERMLMLKPDDRASRDQLIEDLLELQRFEDVLPLLERKIEEASSKSQKLSLLRQLAGLCRDRMGDPDRAFAIYERMLALSPGDLDTLGELAAMDEASGNLERMLATLERQVALAQPAHGAEILSRMAQIAEQRLDDDERAAELLSRAVDLAPEQPGPLHALCELYERGGNYDDLVELLRERALMERNPQPRAELYRRIAQVLQDRVGDEEGAREAWEKLLQIKEDREALDALRQRALQRDDVESLVKLLARLAALESDPLERRDLLFERASLLLRRLSRAADAAADLLHILGEIDPGFEPAMDELRAAAEASGDYRALAQVLQQRLERAQDAFDRVAHARELADLYESKLGDAEHAIAALDAWAAADPQDVEPQHRLCPLLSRARRHQELIVALDAIGLLEIDPQARARAVIQAAELAYAKQGDAEGAWRRLVPLVEQQVPEAVSAAIALADKSDRLDPLYDLLERSGQTRKLLALLRERAERERDSSARAGLLRRIAQLLIDYEADEEGAADAYRKLLEIEEDGDALRFLQAAAIRRDDPEALVGILARLAALEPNAEERRELSFERARLLSTRLERPAEAIPVFQELLRADPELEPALEELLRACEAARDHAALADALSMALARAGEPAEQVDLAARLSEVCLRELGDTQRAAFALQRWAQADPDDPEPHRRLRPILQGAGQERELLASLDALARTEDSEHARIEATLAAASLARNALKDVEAAWQRLAPLLPDADPRIDQALYALAMEAGRQDELYSLLEQAGRHETLAEWLNQRIALERSDPRKAELYRRLAHVLGGPLQDEEAAAQAWARLLKLQEDAEALGFLRAQALRRDDMALLCDCLKRLAALEPDVSEKRDLLYEYGHLLRARLGRPAEAARVLREVVEQLDRDFDPALDELVEACEATSDHASLAWALERVLERERDPEVRAQQADKLATLYEQRLGDPERAAAALRLWIEAAPQQAAPHHRLAALLRAEGQHAALLHELDAIAATDEDEPRRREALLEGAQLAFEQLNDGDGAFARLLPLANIGDDRAESLLSQVAFASGKLEELIALYESAERYDDLIAVLRAQAERAEQPAARAELYRRCALLLSGPLADDIAAAEAFREVLRLEEDPEALAFLRRQATRMDDPADLADILARLAKLSTDPKDKRDLLFERALLLADRLEQRQEAVVVLRALLLEIDPGYVPAIEELVAMCESADDYAGLAFGLEHQLVLARTPPGRAELAQRLADIYEDKVDDPARLVAALLSWCEAEPGSPEPRRRLRPRLEQSGEVEPLLSVLDTLAACETSVEARLDAALAGSELAFAKQRDAEGAWQRLSPFVLEGLERAEAAARALAERSEQWRPLVNLYVLRAQRREDAATAQADWMQAAALYEQRLQEPAEALEADLRALALDINNRALLSEIDRLAAASGAWERLQRVYNRLVQDAPDNVTRIELLARHATLLEHHGNDEVGALERLLAVCRLAPARDDLLEHAASLAARTGSHAELIWLYENLARNATNDEQRARQMLRAAKVADLGLGDREHAMRDIGKALALTEDSPAVAAEIEDLARELDRARPELGKEDARRSLIRIHLELAQQLGEPFGPVLVLRASQLLSDELDDAAACFDALKQGATLFPNDLDLYDALERVALKIKRLDALEAHLSRCVQRATEDEVKRALLWRRGKLLADHLQRPAKAAEVYRELLALGPDNGAAFEALLRSLRQAARYQDLLKLYNERLAATEDLEARLSLMRQMALLWEVELKNRPSAVELWRVVQALAPNDEEATAALNRLGAA